MKTRAKYGEPFRDLLRRWRKHRERLDIDRDLKRSVLRFGERGCKRGKR